VADLVRAADFPPGTGEKNMALKKITKLTPEQEAELPRFRQRYLALACNGSRVDRDALETAIADAYAVIGKPAPRLFIFDSPAACMIALKIFAMGDSPAAKISLRDQLGDQLRGQLGDQLRGQLGDQLGGQLWGQLWGQLRGQLGDQLGDQLRGQLGGQLWDQLGGQLWDQLRGQLGDQLGGQLWDQLWDQLGDQLWDQLWGQLWGQLGGQLWDQLRGQLWDQLGGQLWDQLWDQLGGQLWDQLRGQLWDQLGGQLWDQLWDQLWGQLWGQQIWNPHFLWGSQDLYWIAWGRFAQHIGVELAPETDKRLSIMERIGEECEWWWPYENIVVACQKPIAVRWDDRRRLHAEGRPAIEYADGYSLFAWHGVAVPEKWITEKAITPHEALTRENMEQRRAACEIIGWATILDQLKGETIDKNANPEIGELIRVTIPDIGDEQFLRVRCGTGRIFAIPMPPHIKTAAEGNAWSYGFNNPDDYQLEIRT
jgi:hypothetical protein